MSKIAVTVSALLVLLFVVLCLWENGLFQLHPSFMAISYLGCMFQAIHIFSIEDKHRPDLLSKRKQIFIHTILQVLTLICSTIAFTAIYLNKIQRNKDHFTTWHGLIGFIVYLWTVLQTFAGFFLTFLQGYIRFLGLTYLQLRTYHATSGVLLFTISCFVFVLGMVSNWFSTKMPNNTVLYYIIFYFLMSSMLFLAHTSVEQVKNRYVKNKKSTR